MSAPDAPAIDAAVAMTTVSDKEHAQSLARLLVDSRLAACVTVLEGVRSTYRWQRETVEETEVLLLIKTRNSLLSKLRETVCANHPYELPEWIVLPVIDCHPGYLAWLLGETENPDQEVQ